MESYSKAIYNPPAYRLDHLDKTQKDMYKAIEKNRLADLKELFENTTLTSKYSYFDSFTCQGPFLNVHYEIAAFHGHLECLKYIITISMKCYEGCNWNADTSASAAANGHFNCLKFAYENGCPVDSYTFEYAAEYGQIECLRYLIENCCEYISREIGEVLCANAAKNGHIKCLELLHEEEMRWASTTCVCAAECALKYNQVECLKYAYENGCPYPEELKSIIVRKILIPKWYASVKVHFIIYYWMNRSAKASCAENGRARIEDIISFDTDFNSLVL